jgi:hypothetical protein
MIPFNYYISDAGLTALDPSMRPAAWIVPDRYHGFKKKDLLPKAEKKRLEALAPVAGTPREVRGLDLPLAFSSGFTGFAFYDQNDALVIVAANTGSRNKKLIVTLKGLPAGNFRLTDLFTGQREPITVNSAKTEIRQTVDRWDTRVFSLRKM